METRGGQMAKNPNDISAGGMLGQAGGSQTRGGNAKQDTISGVQREMTMA